MNRKLVGRNIIVALGIACIILAASLIVALGSYVSMMNEKNNIIDDQNKMINEKNNTIFKLNSSVADLQSQVSNLQTQVSSLENQVNGILKDLNATINDVFPKTVVVCNRTYIPFYDLSDNLLHNNTFSIDVSQYHKVWIYYDFLNGSDTTWRVWFSLPNVDGLTVARLDITDVPWVQVVELDIQGPNLHIDLERFSAPSEWTIISIYLYLT